MHSDTLIDFNESMLFDAVPCYAILLDKEYRIVRGNKRFRDVFGDKQGEYCFTAFKQRESKCELCVHENTFHMGKCHKSEELFFTPKGKPIHVIAETSPIFDSNGNVAAIIEMATDITEIRKLQNKLEVSTEKYRMLYDEVPCFISVQNKDFIIIDSNEKFDTEFGTGEGKFCYEVYKKRSSRCEICPVAESFEDGLMHTSEEIVAGKDGQPINVLVIAAPIKDANGNISSVMEMSTDITNFKQMQIQMTNVGKMVSSLAHTIKGIITGLDGGMYVVESGFRKDNQDLIRQGWEIVQRNVERVSHFVLDMLYYAKDRIPESDSVKLKEICEEISQLYSEKLKEKKISLELILNYADIFYGDAKSLYTLILNLMENALHACSWDDMKISHNIVIELKKDDGDIILKVSDNGPGMSYETKSKLFTPLFSTKGSSGSGFGLMVVKKVVDEHCGSIEIESVPDEGTTFIVKLPLKQSLTKS